MWGETGMAKVNKAARTTDRADHPAATVPVVDRHHS